MKYLLIEFLGVFTLVFFRTLSTITIEKDQLYSSYIYLSSCIGFVLIIFSFISLNISQGLFNPTFAITQNMWHKLSTGKTIGYIGAHFISALMALSLIVWIVPYDGYMNISSLNFGLKKIYPNIDFMSVCTIEIIGNMLLYFGFIYYREIEKDKHKGILYYGLLTIVLNISTFELTGGNFNSALIVGGIIYDNVVDYRYIGLFLGQIIGCLIARLLQWQLWGEGEKLE